MTLTTQAKEAVATEAKRTPVVLLVDDDETLRQLIADFLEKHGMEVLPAADGAAADAVLAKRTVDVVVLDVMMPGEDGLALTRSVRTASRIPILLLTAMAEPEDRINGLERGADDYLAKPFEPRELVLRIRNILQRVPQPSVAPTEFRFGACRLDLARGELFRGGDPVHLTSGEIALLVALARRAGEAVSREALSEEAQFSGNVRTVDVQVTRLRRKIERDPKFPRYLQTVRGTGYVLKPD
jgi:two-component system phosphate regulon response regulator OmpR